MGMDVIGSIVLEENKWCRLFQPERMVLQG